MNSGFFHSERFSILGVFSAGILSETRAGTPTADERELIPIGTLFSEQGRQVPEQDGL